MDVPFFVAWILFAVSMFLPAFDDYAGWICARHVFLALGQVSDMGGWEYYYYGAFNIGNLAIALSPVFISFFPPGTREGRRILGILLACTLHVISWSMLEDNSDSIQSGYYLWVASFVIVTGEWIRQTFLRRMASTSTC